MKQANTLRKSADILTVAVVKSTAGRTTHSGGQSMMFGVSKRIEEVFTVPIVSPD